MKSICISEDALDRHFHLRLATTVCAVRATNKKFPDLALAVLSLTKLDSH